MRHLLIWVHCHPHVLSTPGVSWPKTQVFTETFVGAEVIQQHCAFLTDEISTQVWSALRPGPGLLSSAVGLVVSMVPFPLHSAGKAHKHNICHSWEFLSLFVMMLVFLHFLYGDLFWACVGILVSHPPQMLAIPSQKLTLVCITHCCHLLHVLPEILSNLAFLLPLITFHIFNYAF